MDLYLFKPMEEIKKKVREAFGVSITDEDMKPTDAEVEAFWKKPDNTLAMCKVLMYLLQMQSDAYREPNSPTSVETALVAEIDLMEQRLRNRLPMHLRKKKYDEINLLKIQPGLAKCLFHSLLELESAMQDIYNKTKAQERRKAKKQRKKERKASQQEASVEPENQGEANDGLDKEDAVTKKA